MRCHVRDDTPSRTAAWVAAARHLGQLLPESVRLIDDRYGGYFTSRLFGDAIERIAEQPAHGEASSSWSSALRALRHPIALTPGLRSWIVYMQVRSRVIDDAVRAFIADGGRQLVLLGAGYDCRALRLHELAEASAAVFEIDHPATQGHKIAVLDTLVRPGHDTLPHFVAWDFEARPLDELGDALASAGHRADLPTMTIWEGVTMYLSEPAIDASLRAIASWSSHLAMTYFARRDQRRPSLLTRAVAAVVATIGEPWRWGWEPDQLPDYLAQRGLSLTEDIMLAEAARHYLPSELAALVRDPDRRVAFAIAAESIALGKRRA